MRTTAAAPCLAAALLGACADDAVDAPPDVLALPGDAYYPESLIADVDGTLYVGSLATGRVVAFADGDATPTVVVDDPDVTGVAGVILHDDDLWLCSIDTSFQREAEVRRFTLAGAARAAYPLGPNRFCNDLGFDAAGALYVTDSFSGTVLRLPPGGVALAPWVEDDALAPAAPGGFGLDGLVVVDGAIYVNKFDTGALLRVAIGDDGAPGDVEAIAVTPALTAPDGMRALDDGALLVVEGNGRLTRVVVDGATAAAAPLATDLDQPTGVVVARGAAWVAEGQLGRLFATPPEPPNLPFAVRRVEL